MNVPAVQRMATVSGHARPTACSRTGVSLNVEIGHASDAGPREQNEDFCGAALPEGSQRLNKGVMVAVADGLGGHANGREAAEQSVRNVLADYYATPDTWGVIKSVDKVLTALNSWIISYAAKNRSTAGMATTLSAVVFRGNRYYTAHVGDSRIYLLREGRLQCLTTDHCWDHPELRHVLKRAVGLDKHLAVDYADGELRCGDLFVLVTDGIWDVLDNRRLQTELLSTRADDVKALAEHLVRTAVTAGTADNCTALLANVKAVPSAAWQDSLELRSRLPVPPRLHTGDKIDNMVVADVLHVSRLTVLYRVQPLVQSATTGESWVLKTLLPGADDAEAVAALIHEEWLARRVVSHYFPQVIVNEERKYLYYLMTWHAGESLGQRAARGHRFSPSETAQLGLRLLKGLGALHRLAVVHRDIKPDNLHLGNDGRLRILDLGVAAADGAEFKEINNPGTPSFMAPELFAGGVANASSDIYACGVTLYHLLTGKYPYGEVEPFQRPRFGDPIAPTRYRPDVPEWLEAVLLRACARDVKDRFETAEQMLLALERGEQAALTVPRRMPMVQRDPLRLLLILLGLSLLANLIQLYVHLSL